MRRRRTISRIGKNNREGRGEEEEERKRRWAVQRGVREEGSPREDAGKV